MATTVEKCLAKFSGYFFTTGYYCDTLCPSKHDNDLKDVIMSALLNKEFTICDLLASTTWSQSNECLCLYFCFLGFSLRKISLFFAISSSKHRHLREAIFKNKTHSIYEHVCVSKSHAILRTRRHLQHI